MTIGEPLCPEFGTEICPVCAGPVKWLHDHRADLSGLDDGPEINKPRKRAVPKPTDVVSRIRAEAWKTRRQKYGNRGHR